jgi:hypothetical protein
MDSSTISHFTYRTTAWYRQKRAKETYQCVSRREWHENTYLNAASIRISDSCSSTAVMLHFRQLLFHSSYVRNMESTLNLSIKLSLVHIYQDECSPVSILARITHYRTTGRRLWVLRISSSFVSFTFSFLPSSSFLCFLYPMLSSFFRFSCSYFRYMFLFFLFALGFPANDILNVDHDSGVVALLVRGAGLGTGV